LLEEPSRVSRASSNPSNAGARRLDLTVVVPVYNNAATLAPLCDQLKAALGAAGISFELLFVNDGSRDDSAQQLAKLAKQHAEITVVPVFAGRRGRYPSPGRRLTSLMYRSLLRVLTGLPRDANIYVLMEPLLVQALVAFPTRHPSIAAMIGLPWRSHHLNSRAAHGARPRTVELYELGRLRAALRGMACVLGYRLRTTNEAYLQRRESLIVGAVTKARVVAEQAKQPARP
jgi:glycosyltransferase involved in cell wall biosynthesis